MSEEVSDATIEAQARDSGWAPKERFRGDPDKWVDAKTYLQQGETFIPFLKASRRKLQEEVGTLRGEVATIKEQSQKTIDTLKKFNDQAALGRARQEIVELKQQLKAAREADDTELETELEEKIDEQKDIIKETRAAPATTVAEAAPATTSTADGDIRKTPEWREFLEDNPWYESDTVMKAATVEVARQLYMDPVFSAKPMGERFAIIAEKTKKAFRMVEETPPSKSESSTGSTRETEPDQAPVAQSFAKLPKDARDFCNAETPSMVGKGKAFATEKEWKEHFVKHY